MNRKVRERKKRRFFVVIKYESLPLAKNQMAFSSVK